jgi:N-methylhydantoinase A
VALYVGSDIGGTFTDVVGFDSAQGKLYFGKQLTNRDDLAEGVLDCLEGIGLKPRTIDLLKHGTTQVINTLLERRGARTALVTTAGFRDLLEIGRAGRPVAFQLDYEREPPLVERELRLEIDERIDAHGRVVRPLRPAALAELAAELRELRVDAIAVSFLNAYLNPEHELAAARYLRQEFPAAYIATGSELSREWFEYERSATAVANAYVGPRTSTYIDRFDTRLYAANFGGLFHLMASNGGVLTAQRAKESPIALIESGPIGGCVGAAVYADHLGIRNMIAFDMGGTTAKCALIENGQFEVQPTYYVGGYDRGFPLRSSVLDIVEVGTGGGSIAHVRNGRVFVGPQSAGSDPGPACFNRGGSKATVTDINLLLGRIGGGRFLDGELSLDADIARQVVTTEIAQPLGYDDSALDNVAAGVLALANAQMATAINEITTERGRDARDFTLFVFGGGGPLHGIDLARELRIKRVVIPPEPGNFSALGMLFADARADETRSLLLDLVPESVNLLQTAARRMIESVKRSLEHDFEGASMTFEIVSEMRFKGQRHSVRTPFALTMDVEALRVRFLELYRQHYGHVRESAPIEIIALRVSGLATTPKPPVSQLHRIPSEGDPRPRAHRSVYSLSARERRETPIFTRETLPAGFKAKGSMIIEEFGSTSVIGPNEEIEVGALGEITVTFG